MQHEKVILNMVALAKSKSKRAKQRSAMLKMIMPMLSSKDGEKLAEAITQRNIAAFARIWEDIRHKLKDKLEHTKQKAVASADGNTEYPLSYILDEAEVLLTDTVLHR